MRLSDRASRDDLQNKGSVPSFPHLPVSRFVPPEEFAELQGEALALGFRAVAAGPFVRSSYQAETLYRAK